MNYWTLPHFQQKSLSTTKNAYNSTENQYKLLNTTSIPQRNPNDIVTSNLSYEGVEKCEILNTYCCSITDSEDDGIDLPDFDDKGCNTLTTIVVSEQDVIDVLNILDPNKDLDLILLEIKC